MPVVAPAHQITTISTQAALALELGITRRQVSDLVKDPTFPRTAENTFPLAKIAAWKEARDARLARGGEDPLRDQKVQAEIAKLRAESEAKEIKNAITKRELYNAREVDLYLNENAVLVKSRLEMLADEVSAEMPPDYRASAHETTSKVVYRLLLELSGRMFVGSGAAEEEDE